MQRYHDTSIKFGHFAHTSSAELIFFIFFVGWQGSSIVKAFLGEITFPITDNRNSFFNLSASKEIEKVREEKMACRLFGYCGTEREMTTKRVLGVR